MRKLILMLAAVVLTALLFGVSLADEAEEEEHPVPAWTDIPVKSLDMFKGDIEKYKEKYKRTGERTEDRPSENKTIVTSDGWHPKAEYRITSWKSEGNRLILEYEGRNGEKGKLVGTRGALANERKVSLQDKLPLQFTAPYELVEVVHVWSHKGYNWEIMSDGQLKELPVKDNGKMAYPGKTVLIDKGGTMTVWLLQ